MPVQLDILALEPFYGGPRKAMLDAILRHSRHRWTLLRLPPRRIERRLAAAAHWFSEQLSRHWVGRVDLLFTSEAMNLSDLLRQVPALAHKPAVVYFHDNQLPMVGHRAESPLHLVNLTTAAAATEIWFNSAYHQRTFLKRAGAVVEAHPELRGMNPLPELTAKSHLVPPPVDFMQDAEVLASRSVERDPRTLFVDTRDANVKLLNEALAALARRGERFKLVTVGPVEGLDEDLPRRTISERDEESQVRAYHEAAVVISVRPGAPSDHYAIRALNAGCWPVFPASGVYPEILPQPLHHLCLYDGNMSDRLTTQLQNVWWIEHPPEYSEQIGQILSRYSAITACEELDNRLERLVEQHPIVR